MKDYKSNGSFKINPALSSILSLIIFSLPVSLYAQDSIAWSDPSPHKVQFVTVDENVQLEVLDWGGSGRSIVLLTGMGNTAHVFDDFALKLNKDYHMYGVTRRGFGASSQPDSGYEADMLGDDVLAVLDFIKLERPVLVGHSIAGQEMSSIASRFPERLAGLIYLDAANESAFDPDGHIDIRKQNPGVPPPYLTQEEIEAIKNLPPIPQPPPPTEANFESVSAFLSYRKYTGGFAAPESELRQSIIVSPEGRISGFKASPKTFQIRQAIMAGSKSYKQIPVPALAIYSIPNADAEAPWVKDASPEVQEVVAAVDASFAAGREKQLKAFEKGVPGARVVRLPGANHYMFITNEEQVLQEISNFIHSLP